MLTKVSTVDKVFLMVQVLNFFKGCATHAQEREENNVYISLYIIFFFFFMKVV
jgi:hypothetical protein